MIDSSPSLPSLSDPALINEWDEHSDQLLPSSSHCDAIEAQDIVKEEARLRKNREGIVIQHRSWTSASFLISDSDCFDDSPLKKKLKQIRNSPTPFCQTAESIMSYISSPIAYPASSSPQAPKRKLPSNGSRAQRPKTVGGFLNDDSDEEGGEIQDVSQPAAKRQMLDVQTKGVWGEIADGRQPEVGRKSLFSKPRNLDNLSRDTGDQISPKLHFLPSSICEVSSKTATDVPLTEYIPEEKPCSSMFARYNKSTGKELRTCSGKSAVLSIRSKSAALSFEQLVARRSTTKAGHAKKSFYGVEIQQLITDAKEAGLESQRRVEETSREPLLSVEEEKPWPRPKRTLMWTEKYRARRFKDLVGDDRINRQVLRWLKGWDSIVFPHFGKAKNAPTKTSYPYEADEKQHRKILLLTGPPGLGKTTLAHVCAKQAGYDVMEINASDDRSREVVKGRIRTSVGTESVKNVASTMKNGQIQNAARPVCVVVDEVDGVVSGSGDSGEGGFIKALIDLILLDQKNSAVSSSASTGAKKKGDNFRLLRPLILICNDVYHQSLRPLRQSGFAEIVHVRPPPIETVITRMQTVFEKEGLPCETDAVRKLCEATWGVVKGPESKNSFTAANDGDLRGIMVVGEWVAGRLKADGRSVPKLTRKWVEQNIIGDISHGGSGARGAGGGGAKEVVARVFMTGAGFPKPAANVKTGVQRASDEPRSTLHATEVAKRAGIDRLRELVDSSGETDRIVTDVWSTYPTQSFNDDTLLSRPDAAYEWLHFYDSCSSRVFSDQYWELMPYLSQPVLACHSLFASPARNYVRAEQKAWGEKGDENEAEPTPFTGPKAEHDAREATKTTRETILGLQSALSGPLLRAFRSPDDIAAELVPYLVRLLSPDVKPVVVGGSGDQRGIASVRKESERAMVRRAVDVMGGVGVTFERGRLEQEFGSASAGKPQGPSQWVYRMSPALDALVQFDTASTPINSAPPVRFAVRQVLDQEYQKSIIVKDNAARQARFRAGGSAVDEIDVADIKMDIAEDVVIDTVKRDFFGRVIHENQILREGSGNAQRTGKSGNGKKQGTDENKVWISFHEGFSNAVRKPITLGELLKGL